MPLETVSVVIPFYNRSRCVGDAVASIAAQTFPIHETIIVDDGSRQDEAAALDRIAASAGVAVQVVRLPHNRGACVARNVGIARATGSYIAMLDCDDLWMPDKLHKQMRFLAEHPEFGTVTLEQLLATWAVHDMAHVAQISRILTRAFGRYVGPWTRYFSLLKDWERHA